MNSKFLISKKEVNNILSAETEYMRKNYLYFGYNKKPKLSTIAKRMERI